MIKSHHLLPASIHLQLLMTTLLFTLPPSETALDWFQRSTKRRRKRPPTNPAEAATRFLQGTSGISYVDAVWKQQDEENWMERKLRNCILLLEGNAGKTWTLRSLAARFVVTTRPSRFKGNPGALPYVVVLDSLFDWVGSTHTSLISNVVRSTLMRQQTEPLEEDVLLEALNRIHIASADDALDWVAILEVLRYQFLKNEDTPILLIWDGFLEEPGSSSTVSNETVRQLARLLEDCSHVTLVLAMNASSNQWMSALTSSNDIPVRRISLERRNGKDCLATVPAHGHLPSQSFPFSLSLSGILC